MVKQKCCEMAVLICTASLIICHEPRNKIMCRNSPDIMKNLYYSFYSFSIFLNSTIQQSKGLTQLVLINSKANSGFRTS